MFTGLRAGRCTGCTPHAGVTELTKRAEPRRNDQCFPPIEFVLTAVKFLVAVGSGDVSSLKNIIFKFNTRWSDLVRFNTF